MDTPGTTLEETLRRAIALEAREVTFFSGVGAFAITPDGQRTLPMSRQLSVQYVRDLHVACLAVAGRSHLIGLSYARYPVSFPNLGRFQCEYVERRRTSNLRLRRDPDAPQTVETRWEPKLPLRSARASVPRAQFRFGEKGEISVIIPASETTTDHSALP